MQKQTLHENLISASENGLLEDVERLLQIGASIH